MKENSNRGQMRTGGVILAIVGLSVAAIITAFVLPVALDSIEGPENATDINQSVGEDYELAGQLNSTLTGVTSGTPDTATYNVTIYDNTSDRESQTVTVDESDTSTSTVTLDGNDVVINATDVTTADGGYSVATYQYPPDAGWSSGASSVWGVLGLALVLGVMVFIVGVAMDGMDF